MRDLARLFGEIDASRLYDLSGIRTREEAQEAKREWANDIIHGLIINGVATDEIGVYFYADGRAQISVRGVWRYAFVLDYERLK